MLGLNLQTLISRENGLREQLFDELNASLRNLDAEKHKIFHTYEIGLLVQKLYAEMN